MGGDNSLCWNLTDLEDIIKYSDHAHGHPPSGDWATAHSQTHAHTYYLREPQACLGEDAAWFTGVIDVSVRVGIESK